MARPRRHHQPQHGAYDRAYDLTPKTTRVTFSEAADVLTAHGWVDGESFRMRPTSVSPDELLIAPIVGGIDIMPGTGPAGWKDQDHKTA